MALGLRDSVDDLRQDIRYAARGLAHRPAFTALAVITLALGIGGTTTIFSAIQALILKPLPFADPERLMSVSLTRPADGDRPAIDNMVWSYPKFALLRDRQTVFQDLAVYAPRQLNLTGGEAERISGEFVGARYFTTLGIPLVAGTDFGAEADLHFGQPKQVIMSNALWQRRFNADPTILGRTITLDRSPYLVLGVAPLGFAGLSGQADVFIPVTTMTEREVGGPQSHFLYVVARRKPGVTAGQAQSVVALLGAQVTEAFPDPFFDRAKWGATARDLDAIRVAPLVRRSLYVLFGAVSLVLLIACVNLASLLLSRAGARRREIAVRLAIGAGRGRLVRLLLAESVLLSLVGAAVSVVLAWAGAGALAQLNPASTLRAQGLGGLGAVGFSAIHLDATALVFTLAVALLVGVLFGLAPALHATNTSVAGALKEGAMVLRGPAGRRMLVAVEVGLALMLLAASGLMIKSLARLLAVDPGFDPRGVLTVRLTVPDGTLERDSLPGFYAQLLERLGALPGVSLASLANCAPLGGGCNGTRMDRLDRPPVTNPSEFRGVGVLWATPGWFPAMRVPLQRGRLFTDADRLGAPKVVLVSDAAARAFWPDEDPLGKRVAIFQGGFFDGAEVVGIVGDVRTWMDSLPKPDVYLPYFQSPQPRMIIFLRTAGDPTALVPAVRRTVHELAPDYPAYDVQPMTARAAVATAQARFSAVLLALFAGVALTLAVVGIYGVMSFAVVQRTREIGIRMALGAGRSEVQRMVIGEGLRLASSGAALGLVGALAGTRVLRSLLFEVQPSDPPTYVAIVGLLAVAAGVASWMPARRATRINPTEALRQE